MRARRLAVDPVMGSATISLRPAVTTVATAGPASTAVDVEPQAEVEPQAKARLADSSDRAYQSGAKRLFRPRKPRPKAY